MVTLLRAVCDGAVVGWGRWADVGGHVAVAGPGSGGGLGASRLPPCGTLGRGRQLRRFAPAAWGDFGLGANRGLILSREVNDLIWTPKHWHILTAISCGFAVRILRFCGLKVWMLRGFVFTRSLLGKSIRAQLAGVPLWRRSPASSSLDWEKQPR